MTTPLETLLAAFDTVFYPGDLNITNGASIEAGYVASYFKGKCRKSLTIEAMRRDYPGDSSACMSFMTDAAFRYFFPGYMKMAFVDYASADVIFDVVVFRLVDASEPSDIQRKFEEYDREHLGAIARYCTLLIEKLGRNAPADLAPALTTYWHRYLND